MTTFADGFRSTLALATVPFGGAVVLLVVLVSLKAARCWRGKRGRKPKHPDDLRSARLNRKQRSAFKIIDLTYEHTATSPEREQL